MKKINNKGYVLTEVLIVTVVVMIAFLAIYINYYPMMGEYERREAYTRLEPRYALFQMKKTYLSSYNNGPEIIQEFIDNDNLKYIDLLKIENNKLVCKSEYVDDVDKCNTLVEYYDIKRLIVTEYNIDALKNISIEKELDKYIDYLPNYKYVNDNKLFRLIIETNDGYATTELDLLVLRKSLYSVLEDAAREGTYARKYTSEHQDSMDASLSTKNIYYWYGSSAANGTAILDKNNVKFADHCWQMIRTTDTGGVRMIYNGEVVDGKCLNTRGTHVGYASRTTQSLNGTYYYGTDYVYDNGTFSIGGTTSSVQVTSSNGSTVIPTLVGKYTCKSTNATGTCSTLYLVESYYSSYNAYAIPLNANSTYAQFGSLEFNTSNNSPAYVGYMYGSTYPVTSVNNSYGIANYSMSINNNWYYGSLISYNGGSYTLTDPQLISTLSDTNDLIGKYMLGNGGNTSNTTVRYVIGISGTTLYYRNLSSGDLAISMMIGDSYEDNGNGTYTIQSATPVTYIQWYNASDFSIYKGKYVCDGTSATCSNLKHIATSQNPTKGYYYYCGTETNEYKYGEDISYNSGTYTLTGDIKTLWDIYDSSELAKFNTHRYTCSSSTGITCSTVKYLTWYSGVSTYYLNLTGVSSLTAAITNMISTNTTNSTIKTGVEEWYKKYMLIYDNYIEDTVYCNDRSIKSFGGYDPSNTIASNSDLRFKGYDTITDLSCTNITDKFSVSNNSAKLAYKVGLISAPEMELLNQSNARKSGQNYWAISPRYFGGTTSYERYINSNGASNASSVRSTYGVRPVISLIPGVRYTEGDGSMANPYLVVVD